MSYLGPPVGLQRAKSECKKLGREPGPSTDIDRVALPHFAGHSPPFPRLKCVRRLSPRRWGRHGPGYRTHCKQRNVDGERPAKCGRATWPLSVDGPGPRPSFLHPDLAGCRPTGGPNGSRHQGSAHPKASTCTRCKRHLDRSKCPRNVGKDTAVRSAIFEAASPPPPALRSGGVDCTPTSSPPPAPQPPLLCLVTKGQR